MFGALAYKIFGSSNDRVLRGLHKPVDQINALEPEMEKLSDEELRGQTAKLKKKLEEGATLDDILPEAFATVREAAKRAINHRPFDVQLMGGIVLHQGKIAEMRTGEGKTLVATLPSYLHALTGKGAHVVTVNDYLAHRDADWMRPVFSALDMTVGSIVANLSDAERRAAYNCDITYGTNNEFGFDYLRDNMKMRLEDMVQREFNFALVDEVDSILVDEARTPLIISGAVEDVAELYIAVDKIIPHMVKDDYEIDEKVKNLTMTERGIDHVEELLRDAGLLTDGNLYDPQNVSLVHHVNQALRAHKLFNHDDHYIVKDGEIVLIDEFTGRMMEGRRLSEGLHQAIEAKEGVHVQNENQVLASITFQNYFRLYPTLSGMTGTAMTEATEFEDIYGLQVVEIPTNVPQIRLDHHDEIYRTAEEKYEAILEVIEDCHDRKQPILVGTTSIERSEFLSKILKKRKIPHNVLNARYHEQEAHIISKAGEPGAVTIATNMAGRGTDIKLGGNFDMRCADEIPAGADDLKRKKMKDKIRAEIDEAALRVKEQGGLYVIGTERHESRRIDNQLRGRSGRQGDPGASKFFISLEDDLMRIFGSERMDVFLRKMGLPHGQPIVHPLINKSLERAQKKVEAQHYDIRKNLLKFDNVMNDQRKVIYEQRKEVMSSDDVSDIVRDMRHELIEDLVAAHMPPGTYAEHWNVETLKHETHRLLGLDELLEEWAKEEGVAQEEILEKLTDHSDRRMAEKAASFTPPVMRMVEKSVLLQLLDQSWRDHLQNLEHLRQGIFLRAYGQKDPLNEYKSEAFSMFEEMLDHMRENVTMALSLIEAGPESRIPSMPSSDTIRTTAGRGEGLVPEQGAGEGDADMAGTYVKPDFDAKDPTTWGDTPRNAPCPCGSKLKYKHCHGKKK
ncbi:MAG: preprotein translocase subunit SecA [Alphaproteobacteria bacterium]|nr:MAG: preprotein translocase subunit SecA [Alphaproteobacteria bacterium]